MVSSKEILAHRPLVRALKHCVHPFPALKPLPVGHLRLEAKPALSCPHIYPRLDGKVHEQEKLGEFRAREKGEGRGEKGREKERKCVFWRGRT